MPLVSAIMPTADRGRFIWAALTGFSEQTYPRKELVIVDDGADSIADIVSAWCIPYGNAFSAGIRYHRLETKEKLGDEPAGTRQRATTGTKRNIACDASAGEIILHWDDDDWSDSCRMADQVHVLRHSGAALTGYHQMLFWDEIESQAWLYSSSEASAVGTSLAYWRYFWERNPFPDTMIGEDTFMVNRARERGGIAAEPLRNRMVARTHAQSSDRATGSIEYQRVERDALPEGFWDSQRLIKV